MDKMALVISAAGFILIPLFAYIFLKGTILDFTHFRRNPWPLLWYKTIFLILVPLVVVSALGIDNIPILFVAQPGSETKIAAIVIMTLFLYIISLGMFLRAFGLSFRRGFARVETTFNERQIEITNALAIFGILLFVFLHFLGYRHAFLVSIVGGENLLKVRLANAYNSRVPSQIASMLLLTGYLLAALAGYRMRRDFKGSLFCLAVALFLLSARGDKAPPIMGLIIYILAQGKILPERTFSVKGFLFILFTLGGVLGIAYLIVGIQIPNLTWQLFVTYLLNRLGVGQMAGVYETFGLVYKNSFPEGSFYWHMVPGARFFVNYVDYQKVLMMITEGYTFSGMGVKNTYFIAEAYAMGGMPLVFLSPIIVSFSTAFGLSVLRVLMKRFVGKNLAAPLALLLYLRTHDITGGFASFPLFKGLILVVIQLTVMYVFCSLIMWMLRIVKSAHLPHLARSSLEHSPSISGSSTDISNTKRKFMKKYGK